MTRLRDHLTFGSRLQYFVWRASRSSRTLKARLRNGDRLLLRPPPATDLATANEVFVGRVYELPRAFAGEVRSVVDLGANVGYSVLWWLRQYPAARATAYEPLAAHCDQLRRQLQACGLTGRVVLHEAAAGTAPGKAHFRAAENQSAVVESGTGLTVPVRDVFADLADVDVLKMDIEGAEYDILADPRFEAIRPPVVVLEWHRTADPRSGPTWCEERLSGLGYTVVRLGETDTHGVVWGLPS